MLAQKCEQVQTSDKSTHNIPCKSKSQLTLRVISKIHRKHCYLIRHARTTHSITQISVTFLFSLPEEERMKSRTPNTTIYTHPRARASVCVIFTPLNVLLAEGQNFRRLVNNIRIRFDADSIIKRQKYEKRFSSGCARPCTIAQRRTWVCVRELCMR